MPGTGGAQRPLTSYRTLSPTADRDLALMGLLVAALASLMALGSALVLGAAITTALLGGPWHLPGISAWVPTLFTVVGNPTHPGAALGEPWATTLAGHTGLYWMVTVLVTVLGGGAVTALGVPAWRRFGPTPAGHASRAEIRRELSLTAARVTSRECSLADQAVVTDWLVEHVTQVERRGEELRAELLGRVTGTALGTADLPRRPEQVGTRFVPSRVAAAQPWLVWPPPTFVTGMISVTPSQLEIGRAELWKEGVPYGLRTAAAA